MKLSVLTSTEVIGAIKVAVEKLDNRHFDIVPDQYSGDYFVQRVLPESGSRPQVKQEVRLRRETLEDESSDTIAHMVVNYLNLLDKAEKRWRQRYD